MMEEDSLPNSAIQPLHSLTKSIRSMFTKNARVYSELQCDNDTLRDQVSRNNSFRDEITDDFSRIKNDLETQERQIATVLRERDEVTLKLQTVEQEHALSKRANDEMKAEYDRFIDDVMSSLRAQH